MTVSVDSTEAVQLKDSIEKQGNLVRELKTSGMCCLNQKVIGLLLIGYLFNMLHLT
jgi:hypothetical protein